MKENRIVYAVDLDWTLCEWEFRWEWEPRPLQKRIDKINSMYKQWHIILIYTARAPEYFQVTLAWLIKYWVMHHGINMRIKPWADTYIDDKAISADLFFNDFVWNTIQN